MRLNIEQPVIYGEQFDRFRAEIATPGRVSGLDKRNSRAGSARVLLTGAYEHPVNDYRNGRLRFDVSTQSFSLQRVANIQKLRPGVKGAFELKASGSATVTKGDLEPGQTRRTVGLARFGSG